MRQRGLTDFEISLALERAEVDWRAIAEKVYYKKMASLPRRILKKQQSVFALCSIAVLALMNINIYFRP